MQEQNNALTTYGTRAIYNAIQTNGNDVWQTMMDVGVERLQKLQSIQPDRDYATCINVIGEEYGELIAFAVALGHLNYQVGNGGFQQYFDNGFLTGTRDNVRFVLPQAKVLRQIMGWFKKYEFHLIQKGQEVFNILSHVEIETYTEDEMTYCRVKDSESIDTQYYEISTLFVQECKKQFGDLFAREQIDTRVYRVFTRTWWKENPEWPNGLEPHAGRKYTIHRHVVGEHLAREICKQWNDTHKPGRLSKKAEYDRE